jgi:hypothetical protein
MALSVALVAILAIATPVLGEFYTFFWQRILFSEKIGLDFLAISKVLLGSR